LAALNFCRSLAVGDREAATCSICPFSLCGRHSQQPTNLRPDLDRLLRDDALVMSFASDPVRYNMSNAVFIENESLPYAVSCTAGASPQV